MPSNLSYDKGGETRCQGGPWRSSVFAALLLVSATAASLAQSNAAPPADGCGEVVTIETHGRTMVLALLNMLFLLLGLFLHSAAAIILVVPVVMPLVRAVGIDPVHFGLIVTVNLGIGQQTPPMASVLTVACSIAKADMWEVTKVNLYFIGVLLFVLLLVTYVPAVPLSLVRLFYG